jgi:hypothetical protein
MHPLSPLSKIIGLVGGAIIPTAAAPHFIRNVFAVGCALLLASAVAGTILSIPYTRRIMSDSAVRREKRLQRHTDDAEFDDMFWDEYDSMMKTAGGAGGGAENLVPVSVSTPRGDVVMTYVPSRGAFGYYTDRRGSIAYTHLETVARKFLLHHARPDIAKRVYADRRLKKGGVGLVGPGGVGECCEGEDAILVPAPPAPVVPVVAPDPVVPAVQGIFARLRSYNRKPAAASAAGGDPDADGSSSTAMMAQPLEYTRFVWMGTLHDLAEASKPPADYERVDYDYAEFKRLRAAAQSSATVSESDNKKSDADTETDVDTETEMKPVPIISSSSSSSDSESE